MEIRFFWPPFDLGNKTRYRRGFQHWRRFPGHTRPWVGTELGEYTCRIYVHGGLLWFTNIIGLDDDQEHALLITYIPLPNNCCGKPVVDSYCSALHCEHSYN